jgi:hypothetical protein
MLRALPLGRIMAYARLHSATIPLVFAVPVALVGAALLSSPEFRDGAGQKEPIVIRAVQAPVSAASSPDGPILKIAEPPESSIFNLTEYKFADQISVLSATDDVPQDPTVETL